jgi:hypothetical protein
MAEILQLRRGTTAQNDAFTGSIAEVTVDTDRQSLRLHDSVTQGGRDMDVARNLTSSQRDALISPPSGLTIYNTTTNKLQVRTNTSWVDLH